MHRENECGEQNEGSIESPFTQWFSRQIFSFNPGKKGGKKFEKKKNVRWNEWFVIREGPWAFPKMPYHYLLMNVGTLRIPSSQTYNNPQMTKITFPSQPLPPSLPSNGPTHHAHFRHLPPRFTAPLSIHRSNQSSPPPQHQSNIETLLLSFATS